MDTPLVSILVVNYKVSELVHQSIQSIEKFVKTPYEVIILDNDSRDASVESLNNKYEFTKIIASTKNLGFGAGNNRAYEEAKGKYIFLLNPDTILIDDSLDRMVNYLEIHSEVGLVSPTLLYEDLTLQRSVRKFYSYFGSLLDNRFMNPVVSKFPAITKALPGLVNHSISQEVDWAKGAALLIKREVINQIGLFDEDFWIYGEEMDLCFRIGRAGWKKVFLHDCRIIHLEGKSTVQSSTKMFLMNYKGMYLFLSKHFSVQTLKNYHARVWVLSRLIALISITNKDRFSLYRSLMHWHKTEAPKMINH